MDWGAGNYERTAAQLHPAARACIDLVAPAAGERVIDVGCGTGNAALLAAELGARVTGVDPAERLLGVAHGRARGQGLEIDFIGGEASSLPAPDAAADAAVSVFGVIFDPDAAAAARELARVTAAGGRIVLSAWIPGGALFDVIRMGREAIASATAAPAPAPAPFAWHRADALISLFSPLGFFVELHEQPLAFTAGSASEFVEAEFRDHPLWVNGRTVLEERGKLRDIRDRALAIFEAANEDPDGFQVTSRYVMARMQRS
jgi:SAM-dependent methyltransferase